MIKFHTQSDLNRLGCQNPNCTSDHSVIYYHPRCHHDGKVQVAYDKRTGAVTVECGTCEKPVIAIAVAP